MNTIQALDRLRDQAKREIRAAKMDPRRINSAIGRFASGVATTLGASDPDGKITAQEVEFMRNLARAHL